MNQLDKDTMTKIYKHGTYYNPASSHYGEISNVACDRCHKNNLDVCIGWQTYDLCLLCVNEINNKLKIKPAFPPVVMYTTNMMQNQFRNGINQMENDISHKTYMMQNQFKCGTNQMDNDTSFKTFMIQNIFRQ